MGEHGETEARVQAYADAGCRTIEYALKHRERVIEFEINKLNEAVDSGYGFAFDYDGCPRECHKDDVGGTGYTAQDEG